MRVIREASRPWAYLTWPNRLTLLRLLLVAPFVVLMQHQQSRSMYRFLALGIFLFMAFSDLADGFLARKFRCASRLGAILDPLADKALIVCAAVLLSLNYSHVRGARLGDWVVVMIVGKDLWVVVGFIVVFLLTGKVRVSPTLAGKACTCGQLVMVTAFLISPELNGLTGSLGTRLAAGLSWAVAGLCVASVVSYTRLGLSIVAVADQDGPGDQASRAA